MKVMKVFDCRFDMPEDVRAALFELEQLNRSNGSYVKWEINSGMYGDGDDPRARMIDEWLVAQGCTPPVDWEEHCGETVLIKYWW